MAVVFSWNLLRAVIIGCSLELAVAVIGAATTTRAWLDGSLVTVPSRTVTLTATPSKQLQTGQVMSEAYNAAFEDAASDA